MLVSTSSFIFTSYLRWKFLKHFVAHIQLVNDYTDSWDICLRHVLDRLYRYPGVGPLYQSTVGWWLSKHSCGPFGQRDFLNSYATNLNRDQMAGWEFLEINDCILWLWGSPPKMPSSFRITNSFAAEMYHCPHGNCYFLHPTKRYLGRSLFPLSRSTRWCFGGITTSSRWCNFRTKWALESIKIQGNLCIYVYI